MEKDFIDFFSFFGSEFKGFAIQISHTELEEQVLDLIAKHPQFGEAWQMQSFGGDTTDFLLNNDQLNNDQNSPSFEEAWNLTYVLRLIPGIIYAEPIFDVKWRFNLNKEHPLALDLLFGDSSNSETLKKSRDNPNWIIERTHVQEAWQLFFSNNPEDAGEGIIIGHPDTGYLPHPEIINNLILDKSRDFVERNKTDALDNSDASLNKIETPGHGTATASVIVSLKGAQDTYNLNDQSIDPTGKAVTGIAPGAKLIPLRVSNSVVSLASVINLAESIEYATNEGAHIISISMGGIPHWRLRKAIVYAQKRGVIVVAAAGNLVPFVLWPAAYDEVIAVAASNIQDEVFAYSSRGPKVDVTAPGELVWCARFDKQTDGFKWYVSPGSGTSFAVAVVAGAAALWLARWGRDNLIQNLGGEEKIPFVFNQILRDSCDKPQENWDTQKFGAGIINVRKLLEKPLPTTVSPPATNLEDFPPIDQGILETFAHLFEPNIISNNNTLSDTLAKLFQISEAELKTKLANFGQELARLVASVPSLYEYFKWTLLSPLDDNIEQLRSLLLNQNVISNNLRKELEKR